MSCIMMGDCMQDQFDLPRWFVIPRDSAQRSIPRPDPARPFRVYLPECFR